MDVIDRDRDLRDFAADGGDGIKLIDWFAECESYYPIRLHTINPLGRENMRREMDRYRKQEVIMKPELAEFSTAELVKELSEREGVVKTAVEPYQRYRFTAAGKEVFGAGPVVVLWVWD